MARTMKRHDWWREQYHSNRYLAHASDDEVRARAAQVANNLFTVTLEGKLGMVSGERDLHWLELWTHVLEEAAIRAIAQPDLMAYAKEFGLFRNVDMLSRAASLCETVGPLPEKVFVKYTKSEWARSLIEEGNVRVSPASSYDDPSLNPAQRDDELRKCMYHRARMKKRVDGKLVPIEPPVWGTVRQNWEIENDFYVYCGATTLKPRLFLDFDADACVVIREPDEFFRRLVAEMDQRTGEEAWMHGSVLYVDPYAPPSPDEVATGFMKQLAFAYQGEARILWWPMKPDIPLETTTLRLGSLRDIAEVHYL